MNNENQICECGHKRLVHNKEKDCKYCKFIEGRNCQKFTPKKSENHKPDKRNENVSSHGAGSPKGENHSQDGVGKHIDLSKDVGLTPTPDTSFELNESNASSGSRSEEEILKEIIKTNQLENLQLYNGYYLKDYIKQAIQLSTEKTKQEILKEINKDNLKLSFSDIKLECSECKENSSFWSRISESPRKEVCIYCAIKQIISGEELKQSINKMGDEKVGGK